MHSPPPPSPGWANFFILSVAIATLCVFCGCYLLIGRYSGTDNIPIDKKGTNIKHLLINVFLNKMFCISGSTSGSWPAHEKLHDVVFSLTWSDCRIRKYSNRFYFHFQLMMGLNVHLKSWKCSVIIKVLLLHFLMTDFLQITRLFSFIERSFCSPYTRMLNSCERVRVPSCPTVKSRKSEGSKISHFDTFNFTFN